ncbi:hypothetical protein FIP59_29680, partial [Pseudomonas fluorescens]
RPAGLPTDSSLRSASVVNGACQIKINSRSKAEHGGLTADLSGRSKSTATPRLPDEMSSKCGSGLARESGGSVSSSVTDAPPSRASPLPQC